MTRTGSSRSRLAELGAVGAAGLLLGVTTAYAQGWLPEDLGSLANSSGAWAVVAFVLALIATEARTAALYGCLALLALLLGYVLGAGVRGFASGTALVVFWGAAAIAVGPALGVGAHWLKTGTASAAALGVGAMSGVLVGEGAYGVSFVADTTYPPYWWGELGVGVVLLAAVAWRRLEGARPVAVALATSAVTAAAFVLVYGQNLISVLS